MAGGADVYGLTGLHANDILPASVFSNAPQSAAALLFRLDSGMLNFNHDFAGHDLLLFVNLSEDEAIDDPKWGVGVLQNLKTRGTVRNPLFTLGAGGAINLTQLGALEVYATLVPDTGPTIQVQAAGTVDSETFSYSGLTLGKNQGVYLTRNRLGAVESAHGTGGRCRRRPALAEPGRRRGHYGQPYRHGRRLERWHGRRRRDSPRPRDQRRQSRTVTVMPGLEHVDAVANPLHNTFYHVSIDNLEQQGVGYVISANFAPNSCKRLARNPCSPTAQQWP